MSLIIGKEGGVEVEDLGGNWMGGWIGLDWVGLVALQQHKKRGGGGHIFAHNETLTELYNAPLNCSDYQLAFFSPTRGGCHTKTKQIEIFMPPHRPNIAGHVVQGPCGVKCSLCGGITQPER